MSINIAIIGLGTRGLIVLERLIAIASERHKADKIIIYAFDPQKPGHGCHYPNQKDHLILNTLPTQMTLFSDESVKNAGPILEGPTFYQWLNNKIETDTHFKKLFRNIIKIDDYKINSNRYYPRKLFSHYLQWVYNYLKSKSPFNIDIRFVNSSISKAKLKKEDNTWTLSTETENFEFDYVFITTGHGYEENRKEDLINSNIVINNPYPIDEKLNTITSANTVAIEGMGLSAFDIISELTIGKGGKFIRNSNGKLEYIPSNKEPKIIAFSRSGLPLQAKGINKKIAGYKHHLRFLTIEKVEFLRLKSKIDFKKDLLPLFIMEIEYVYYEVYLKNKYGHVKSEEFCNKYIASTEIERLKLIQEWIPESDQFLWKNIVSPIPNEMLHSEELFKSWLISYLENDITEAQKGNVDSPIKAASYIIPYPYLRRILRAAISFGGLDEESHRWLCSNFLSVTNRIASCPPIERIEQMVALINKNILIADMGPGTFFEFNQKDDFAYVIGKWKTLKVDKVIKGQIPMPSLQENTSSLFGQMIRDGYMRPFCNGSFHPGGIDINRNFNLINKEGLILDNIWALGIPTEGPTFHNYLVPQPNVNSPMIVDTGMIVKKMFLMIDKRQLSKNKMSKKSA
ncbi:MAG: FAD/NAD(P)-binding protein [Pseudomonadota bacterium]